MVFQSSKNRCRAEIRPIFRRMRLLLAGAGTSDWMVARLTWMTGFRFDDHTGVETYVPSGPFTEAVLCRHAEYRPAVARPIKARLHDGGAGVPVTLRATSRF
jgi:hypothetical protein